ncbi:MAG: hypothetical protein ACKVW3_03135 [Phycisphaerales bacterium]
MKHDIQQRIARLVATTSAILGVSAGVIAGGVCYADRELECCLLSLLNPPTVCPVDDPSLCENGGNCCNDVMTPSNKVPYFRQVTSGGKISLASNGSCECRYQDMTCNAQDVCAPGILINETISTYIPSGASCP